MPPIITTPAASARSNRTNTWRMSNARTIATSAFACTYTLLSRFRPRGQVRPGHGNSNIPKGFGASEKTYRYKSRLTGFPYEILFGGSTAKNTGCSVAHPSNETQRLKQPAPGLAGVPLGFGTKLSGPPSKTRTRGHKPRVHTHLWLDSGLLVVLLLLADNASKVVHVFIQLDPSLVCRVHALAL